MIYHNEGIFLLEGRTLSRTAPCSYTEGRCATISHSILAAHRAAEDADGLLRLKFDALISHDITYVGIIQTARASGMKEFPVPYVLTNCHNSLCAVGGTINADDHLFGYTAAQKYGGVYVPPNQSVIHQYARESLAACGSMILGSDSHTRYGSFGCMGVGEGGPELVKQLLGNTYDVPDPSVVLIYVTGQLNKGVGPHDVALVLCKELFGKVKNAVLEFVGPGISSLSADERAGIDVMTTETACLSSVWETDEVIRAYYENHGRPEAFSTLFPGKIAHYDGYVTLDLSEIEPMIALPYHPSNALPIRELKADPLKYLAPLGLADKVDEEGNIRVDQGVIAGCSGGLYGNLCAAADILAGHDTGSGLFSLNVYPASVPVNQAIAKNGVLSALLESGAVVKPCFCGPCFGAGDVPAHHGLSIRHTTRNFPNREGSKPDEGQEALVALMDARSIAATAAMGGVLTGADELEFTLRDLPYSFNGAIYAARCLDCTGKANPDVDLVLGPNITDWPVMEPLKEDLVVKLAAVIRDDVTTTDELIPSGETSSYRSNPLRLAESTLSRREPEYVARAKAIAALSAAELGYDPETTTLGSAIFANRPGDGSAREQAASCQRVLGGVANLCLEYATKRYRSNCINWGILPFTVEEFPFETGCILFVPGIRTALLEGRETLTGYVDDNPITLRLAGLTPKERQILLDGCLMNHYKFGQEV